MENLLKLVPLGLLILVAVVFVVRGLRTRPDDTNNKARGGGPDSTQGL